MSFWLLMITDHPSNYLRGRSSRVGASPADVLAEFRGSALFIPSVWQRSSSSSSSSEITYQVSSLSSEAGR